MPAKGRAGVPVTTIDARIVTPNIEDRDDDMVDDAMGPAGGSARTLPDGCRAMFEITSSDKTQRFAVHTSEDASAWVNSLRQMRQDAITREMGHSSNVPYPPGWESFDRSASRLVERKCRIRKRLDDMDRREMEMHIAGGGMGGGGIGITGHYG